MFHFSKLGSFLCGLSLCAGLIQLGLTNLPLQAQTSGNNNNCSTTKIKKDKQASGQKLLAKAQQKGKVPVIVTVAVNGLEQERCQVKNKDGAQALKQKVQTEVNKTIQKGNKLKNTALRRSSYSPILAMEADVDLLQELLGNNQIEGLSENKWLKTSLATSTATIGASTPTNGAWAKSFDGTGKTVVVLDNGVDGNAPFFKDRIVNGFCSSVESAPDFDSLCPGDVEYATGIAAASDCDAAVGACQHGTHVSGIAVGKEYAGQPSGPFSGVARSANLITGQVFTRINRADICGGLEETPCLLSSDFDSYYGLEEVYFNFRFTHDIAAVNMSLGGGQYFDQASCVAEQDPAYPEIIANLKSVGIATIVAAGNESYTNSIGAPACLPNAIAVANTNQADTNYDESSNVSELIAISAPGENIRSSVMGGNTFVASGTSMSAPHVAGAWAIMKQKNPNASVDEILTAMQKTGKSITDTRPGNAGITKPRLKLNAALDYLGRKITVPQTNFELLRNAAPLPAKNDFTARIWGSGSPDANLALIALAENNPGQITCRVRVKARDRLDTDPTFGYQSLTPRILSSGTLENGYMQSAFSITEGCQISIPKEKQILPFLSFEITILNSQTGQDLFTTTTPTVDYIFQNGKLV